MQDVKTVALAFTELLKADKFEEAEDTYWADDVVSIEAEEGEFSYAKGRADLKKKHAWWEAQVEAIHSASVEGPYVHGDQFLVRFQMDLTMKGHGRMAMDEIGAYTVKDGKIVEERFFYAQGDPVEQDAAA
jgi:ketosteroid isomerase-like protein